MRGGIESEVRRKGGRRAGGPAQGTPLWRKGVRDRSGGVGRGPALRPGPHALIEDGEDGFRDAFVGRHASLGTHHGGVRFQLLGQEMTRAFDHCIFEMNRTHAESGKIGDVGY